MTDRQTATRLTLITELQQPDEHVLHLDKPVLLKTGDRFWVEGRDLVVEGAGVETRRFPLGLVKRGSERSALREYKAIVWPRSDDAAPGERVTLMARDPQSAMSALEQEFGADSVISCWNEEDAARPR